jgi:hypothetical protein
MKLSNFILLLLLLLFNSCSEPLIDFDKQENICKYSKTLSLADSTGKNSLDLIVKTNSQILLDKYTTASVSLQTTTMESSTIAKSAMVSNDTIDEPTSENYIEFIVINEVFENIADYTIDMNIDFDKKNSWKQQSWTVACDYCDIFSNKKIYYKIEYQKNGEWLKNAGSGSVKNDLVSIKQTNSDSLKIYVTYKNYDCFNLNFYY